MKDVTPASLARSAFLKTAGCSEDTFEDQQLLLDLYTLLVMVKGRHCEPEDVKLAYLVAGLRYGPNPPYSFDALDDSISDDVHDGCVQDDWISVLNAAALLEQETGDNVRPLSARRGDNDNPGGAK